MHMQTTTALTSKKNNLPPPEPHSRTRRYQRRQNFPFRQNILLFFHTQP